MTEEAPTHKAPYVPWQTFEKAIDEFAEGLPNRVDRSVFPKHSGAVQNQLFSSFKFLGLVDGNDEPTDSLKAISSSDLLARKELLTKTIEERYAALFALDLAKATPAQLAETIEEAYKVKGDTKTKAIRFFLSALKYLEISVSPHLNKAPKASATPRSGQRKRTKPPKNNDQHSGINPDNHSESPASGSTKTISLKSGGSVSLSIDFDPFSVNDKDREFVFGLIGQLKGYEATPPDPLAGES